MVSLLERQAKKLKVTVELKEKRFESFFNVTFRCKQACKLPKCVLKESKKVILFEVFETIWTSVRTFQNGHPTPLKIIPFSKSLSLGFILKIFLKFRKFQPVYSYKIYSYQKEKEY